MVAGLSMNRVLDNVVRAVGRTDISDGSENKCGNVLAPK